MHVPFAVATLCMLFILVSAYPPRYSHHRGHLRLHGRHPESSHHQQSAYVTLDTRFPENGPINPQPESKFLWAGVGTSLVCLLSLTPIVAFTTFYLVDGERRHRSKRSVGKVVRIRRMICARRTCRGRFLMLETMRSDKARSVEDKYPVL